MWTYPLDRVVPEPAEWAERAIGSLDLVDHPLASLTYTTAAWGAQQAGRYDDTLGRGEAAIALGKVAAPQDLWIAYFIAVSGALYLGRVDLATYYNNRVVPAARETGDDWAVCRALWCPTMGHTTMRVEIDPVAGADECLALAERSANPSLLARAHLVNGVVTAPGDVAEALEHFAAAEHFARLGEAPHLVGFAKANSAGATAVIDPVGGLKALYDLLEWRQVASVPMGILRGALRDLLPALDELELHRLVVMIDVHVPPYSFFQTAKAAESLEHARQALGSVEVGRASARARALDFDEILRLLRSELEAVL